MEIKVWHKIIKQDITQLYEFIDYYSEQAKLSKQDLKMKGNIERLSSELPSIVETRFNQLQDIEAVLEHLNIQYNKLRSTKFKTFFENQNIGRVLTARDCEKYVDSDDEVCDMAELINEVALIRNQFLGIMKGLDIKQWQITNVVKLRSVGIEDASL